MRWVSTTSTPTCQSPSWRSIEITHSGCLPVKSATCCAALRAASAASACPLRRGPVCWAPVSRAGSSSRARRVRRGVVRCSSATIASHPGRAPPGHQALQQLVLELGGLLLGELAAAAPLVDPVELGPDARGVVVLLLGLVADLLGQPHDAPHGRERQA